MKSFSFFECFISLLLLFWVILIVIVTTNIILNIDNIFSQRIISAFSEIKNNTDVLIRGLPVLIPMFLLVIFMIFIIPIICFKYLSKHKKYLKSLDLKEFNYKKLVKIHFFMGLFSPIFIPLFLGPKILVSGLLSFSNNKGYTNYYTKYTDSKGNTTYVDTIIDNDTGYGSTKIEDSKGNKSYHYTHRY